MFICFISNFKGIFKVLTIFSNDSQVAKSKCFFSQWREPPIIFATEFEISPFLVSNSEGENVFTVSVRKIASTHSKLETTFHRTVIENCSPQL